MLAYRSTLVAVGRVGHNDGRVQTDTCRSHLIRGWPAVVRQAGAHPAPVLDDLVAARQTRLRHRHRDLSGLRRGAADHRLHRRPRGDQEDSYPPRHQRPFRSSLPVAARSGATAGALALIEPTTYHPSHTTGADPDGSGREALGLTGTIRAKPPRLRTISRPAGGPREAGTQPDNPPKGGFTAT